MEKNTSQELSNYTFEKFVQNFDENDRFTRRLFEFMLKDTAHKSRRFRSRINLSLIAESFDQ